MPEGLSDALIAAMTEERLGSNLSAFNFWAAIGFIWCSCFFALNFTTCGRLGIEVNQYNNPIEVYSDDTIEDMREEKVVLDHPEVADKLLKSNAKKHEHQMNPIAAQKLKADKFDPKRSSVMAAINASERPSGIPGV